MKRNTYGGKMVSSVAAIFRNDALDFVLVSIAPASFEDLATAIALRFGEPTKSAQDTIRTKGGVEYQNATRTWERPAGALSIARYGSSVDNGHVIIESTAARVARLERAKAAGKAAPKDL